MSVFIIATKMRLYFV